MKRRSSQTMQSSIFTWIFYSLNPSKNSSPPMALNSAKNQLIPRLNKPTKKKQPKNKAAKSEKIDEEVLKKIKEDNDKIEKETKEKRREILRNVFQKEIAVHQERASVLWNEFTTTIVKMLNNAREFGAIEIPKATPEVKEIINLSSFPERNCCSSGASLGPLEWIYYHYCKNAK